MYKRQGLVMLFGPIMRSLNIQGSVLNQAVPYLHALNWSTLPLLLYFVFRRYLQGMNPVSYTHLDVYKRQD